jgi:hypothetical protein
MDIKIIIISEFIQILYELLVIHTIYSFFFFHLHPFTMLESLVKLFFWIITLFFKKIYEV